MSNYKAKPKDEHGVRKGTKAGKVNQAVSGKWQEVDEIAKKAKLPRKEVLVKLHAGRLRGLYDYERIIRFKRKKATKKAKKNERN